MHQENSHIKQLAKTPKINYMSATFCHKSIQKETKDIVKGKIKTTMLMQILGFQTPGHVEFHFHSNNGKSMYCFCKKIDEF